MSPEIANREAVRVGGNFSCTKAESTHRPSAKIALLHHTGGGNLGDDASIESVIENIRGRWPEATITAFSMNPGDTARRHGISAYPIRRHTWTVGYEVRPEASSRRRLGLLHWFRTTRNPAVRLPRAILGEFAFLVAARRRIKIFDFLVLAGGGQLTERSGPWAFPYAIFVWFLLARSARVKCVVLNVGAGPLTGALSKFFVTRALFAADYVSFRDEESQILARNIGFTGKSYVFPDNVYALRAPLPTRGYPKRRDLPVVGIAPMDYPVDPVFDVRTSKIIYEDLIARLAKFTSLLNRDSYLWTIFGTDIGVDPAAVQDLRMSLQNNYEISARSYEPVKSTNDLLLKMSELDYVVTCRFHGVVFAHLLNKPVLAVSPHPKVTNLMKALGLSKYCMDISTFDPARMAETFECLVKDSDEVRDRMASTLNDHKARLQRQFDELWPANVRDCFSAVGAQ
jgi:polysaccharide pyruvyl transferase WcaK-like protein